MYLGINLSHDASSALIDKDGSIKYAIGEERISRLKNHIGIPKLSIEEILNENSSIDIKKIVYGSHQFLQPSHLDIFLAQEDGNPSSPRGKANPVYPGFTKIGGNDLRKNPLLIHDFICKAFPTLQGSEPVFVRHHDSHTGSALPLAGDRDTLIVSLDGSGDGESGVISVYDKKNGKLTPLVRISELDSLGLLYSAVTAHYNFKPTHHEGKITGLAAFGNESKLLINFRKYVQVKNGNVRLNYVKSQKGSRIFKVLHQFGVSKKTATSLDDLVRTAMIDTNVLDYPDLAFSIQSILEETVCQLIKYWVDKTGVSQIALTGGVFANVKLNQRISEIDGVNFVKVFPNMGDGGIAIGSVWQHLYKTGQSLSPDLISTMSLGTPFDSRIKVSKPQTVSSHEFGQSQISMEIVSRIVSGRVVAILNGSMEFGPRALGNTSIILDPRDREIVRRVNERLKRTEFMPFAPSVCEENFSEWFMTQNQTLQPFEFMTMTCDVLENKRDLVPAVVHVDGTARPQIVSRKSNLYFYNVLVEFRRQTGIPILVNTSFNIHEEPIIRDVDSAISALLRGAIDDLFVGNTLYTLN
jgi:carbamoyltransferase